MIEWQDDKDVFGRMLVLTDNPLFNNLRNAVDNHNADLKDALSWGQLKSKRWLIEELEKLDKDLGTVFLCAGWYATLAAMIFDSRLYITKIRSFDIDSNCALIAETINRHKVKHNWLFKASTIDIHNLEYENFTYLSNRYDGSVVELTDSANTIVNTSCEHIENFADWYDKIPDGKLLVLQSNDYFEIDDHVNCSQDLKHFDQITPMKDTIYLDELILPLYTRFMKIGIK